MKKYNNYLFNFLKYPDVPPDNNCSERAIRNIKLKQKISGQFKSFGGEMSFAKLRSITDTAIKNCQNFLDALLVSEIVNTIHFNALFGRTKIKWTLCFTNVGSYSLEYQIPISCIKRRYSNSMSYYSKANL